MSVELAFTFFFFFFLCEPIFIPGCQLHLVDAKNPNVFAILRLPAVETLRKKQKKKKKLAPSLPCRAMCRDLIFFRASCCLFVPAMCRLASCRQNPTDSRGSFLLRKASTRATGPFCPEHYVPRNVALEASFRLP